MYFADKHLETGANCSHELSTFLKYHMPRKIVKIENPIAKLYRHLGTFS